MADVDGLLENSYRALGLSLDRSEAEALISMLDVNGDHAIQCEELEVRCKTNYAGAWVWVWVSVQLGATAV